MKPCHNIEALNKGTNGLLVICILLGMVLFSGFSVPSTQHNEPVRTEIVRSVNLRAHATRHFLSLVGNSHKSQHNFLKGRGFIHGIIIRSYIRQYQQLTYKEFDAEFHYRPKMPEADVDEPFYSGQVI